MLRICKPAVQNLFFIAQLMPYSVGSGAKESFMLPWLQCKEVDLVYFLDFINTWVHGHGDVVVGS